MVWSPRVNCKHIDNFRRCKIHTAHWLVRWMMPKGRPPCILEEAKFVTLQDGELTCPDFDPYPMPRPPGPGAISGVISPPPARDH